MKLQVKTFQTSNLRALEQKINEFLSSEQMRGKEIKNTSFSSHSTVINGLPIEVYSALVTYIA